MFQSNFSGIFQFLWLIPLLISFGGFFLSIWIIIPAPTYFLFPLAVGAPEISPWLLVVNAIALLLIILLPKGWLFNLALVCSVFGLLLSLIPLIKLPATNARFSTKMVRVLGKDYLKNIPETSQAKMRPKPFVLKDVFRGIPQPKVRIQRGIVFASPDEVELKLNTYHPLTKGKYPTLVVIYGGGWRSGSPNNNEQFSCYMADRGYSVITIDYRHSPKYKFPTQLEDVQTALNYIQTNADELEVDINRIAIMGRSAGGHLATLAAYQPDGIFFKAVISYYGAVDLTEGYYNPPVPNPLDTISILRDFLGGTPEELPELYRQASPINYPRPNLPSSLLVYGVRDRVVQKRFGEKLQAKLQANNNKAILLAIPWAEHAFDAIFPGISNQLALYYTERFLAWALNE